LSAQKSKIDQFTFWLNECNLEFQMPDGYEEVKAEDKVYYSPEKGKFLGRILYKIINQEKDIVIGLTTIPIFDATEKELKVRLLMARAAQPGKEITLADVHQNNAWKNTIKAHIDSAASPPVYADAYRRELINADTAVIFPMKVDNPYQDTYTKCKYVVIQRDNRGEGQLLCFYHDDNAHLVDEEIRRTWGVLKFRADSLHSPTMRVQKSDTN